MRMGHLSVPPMGHSSVPFHYFSLMYNCTTYRWPCRDYDILVYFKMRVLKWPKCFRWDTWVSRPWDTQVSHFTTFRSCSFDQLQCRHVEIMKYLREFVTWVMSFDFFKNDQFLIVFGLICRLLRNAHFLTCLVVWHIDLHLFILNNHP